ncbi:hypothetical protein [Nocardiopsis nanhaiensis]
MPDGDTPVSGFESDLPAWTHRSGQTLYHPASADAVGTVADPGLRVFDLAGLRAVEVSALPTGPRGQCARDHGRGEDRRPLQHGPGPRRRHAMTTHRADDD